MNNRRSLSQSLQMTPQAIAFIKKGPPSNEQTEPTISEAPSISRPDEEDIGAAPAEPDLDPIHAHNEEDKKPRTKKERAGQTRPSEPPTLTTPVVSITTRFRQATAEALRRASLERKLGRLVPYSQQEIVELAVSKWLKENGY